MGQLQCSTLTSRCAIGPPGHACPARSPSALCSAAVRSRSASSAYAPLRLRMRGSCEAMQRLALNVRVLGNLNHGSHRIIKCYCSHSAVGMLQTKIIMSCLY